MPDRIKGVYDALIKEGYTDKDLGGYEKFSKAMRDGKNDAVRRNTYSFLKNRGYSNLGDYDSYSNKLLEIDDVKANTQQKLEAKPVDAAVSKPQQASAAVQQPQTAPKQPVAKQQPKQPKEHPMTEADKARADEIIGDIMATGARAKNTSDWIGGISKRKPWDVGNVNIGTDLLANGQKRNKNVVQKGNKYITQSGNAYDTAEEANEEQEEIDWQNSNAAKVAKMQKELEGLDKQIADEEGRLRVQTLANKDAMMYSNEKYNTMQKELGKTATSGKLQQLQQRQQELRNSIANLQRPGVRASVERMNEDLTTKIGKAYEAAGNKYRESGREGFDKWLAPMGGESTAYGGGIQDAYNHDYDVQILESARRSIKNAQNLINEADINAKNGTLTDWLNRSFAGGAARGLGQSAFDLRTWDFGLNDAVEAKNLLAILKKADNGQKLTENEQALLDAKATEAATLAYFGNEAGRGYKAGQVTGASLPLMVQFAVHPAAALGKTSQGMMMRYMVKRFGTAALKRSLASRMLTLGAKGAARLGGDIAASALITSTTGAGNVTAETMQRMAGNTQYNFTDKELKHIGYSGTKDREDATSAAVKSFVNNVLENFTEMGHVDVAGKWVKKGLAKMTPKSLEKGLERFTQNDFAKALRELGQRTQFHGTIGEYLEEKEGDALRLILGTAEPGANWGTGKGGFFNIDENIDTFLGVGLMGGAFSVMGAAGYRTERYNARKAVENAGNIADAVFADGERFDNWRQIRNTLSFGSDEEVKDVMRDVFGTDNYTDDERKAVAQYAGAAYKMRGIKIAEAKAKAGGDNLMSAYDEGRSLSTAEEMNDARNMYEYRRKQAAEAMGISEDELDAQTEQSTPEMYLRVAMQQGADKGKAVEKYINSKARFDGMIDGLRDNINDKANEAEDAIRQNTNRSMEDAQVVEATLADGTHGYIVSGVVDVTEDGKVNASGTADFMTMRTDDGKIIAVAPSDIENASINAADALVEQARAEIEEQESTAAEADIENGGLNVEQGAPVNFVDDSGQVVNAVSEGVTQTEDGQTIVSLNVNGQSIQMPLDALRGAVDRFNRTRAEQYARQEDATDIEQEGEGVQIEQGQTVTYVGADDTQYTATVMTEPDADGYVEIEVQLADGSMFVNRVKADELMQAATAIEGKPTTTAQTSEEEAQLPPPPTNMTVGEDGSIVEAQQPTEEQTRAIDRIPSHEANGTKVYDWEKAAPEDTYDALVETFGSMADKGVENSVKDIDKQLKAAEKALQKVEGMTIEQMMANPNAIADAQNLVNALNERKKYWESVKNVPTARAAQAEEERKKKEAENSLPPLPENVTVGEDGSLEPITEERKESEPQDKTKQNDSEGKKEEKKPQKPTSNRKKRKTKSDLIDELGQPTNVREWIMRSLYRREYKFIWDSNGKTKGLGQHLGLADSKAERKSYFWMLAGKDKGGMYPESVAEAMTEQINDDLGLTGEARVNSIDVLNELLDVVGSYSSQSRMFDAIFDIHKGIEDGISDEEAEYLGNESLAKSWGFDSFAEYEQYEDFCLQQIKDSALTDAEYNDYLQQEYNYYYEREREAEGGNPQGNAVLSGEQTGKSEDADRGAQEQGRSTEDDGSLHGGVSEAQGTGQSEGRVESTPAAEKKERLYENGGLYIERETKTEDGSYEVYSLHNGDSVTYYVPDEADKKLDDFKKQGEWSGGTAYNITGDSIFRSLEEAKEHAEVLRKRDAANAEYQKKVAEKEKAEAEKAEAEKERKRYGGFTDGKSPMQAANIAKVLDKLHNFTGYGTKAMYKHIEDWAKTDGVTFGVEHVPGKKTPEYYARMKDGSEFLIPKTAYDYAKFVGGKMMDEADIERSKKDAELQSLKQKYSKYKGKAERAERIARLEKALRGMNAPDLAKELADLRRLDELMGEAEQNTAKPSTQEKAEEKKEDKREAEQKPIDEDIKLSEKEEETLGKFRALQKRRNEIMGELRTLLGGTTESYLQKATEQQKKEAQKLIEEGRALSGTMQKDDLVDLVHKVWHMLGQAMRRYEADESKQNGAKLNEWANLHSDLNVYLNQTYGENVVYMGGKQQDIRETKQTKDAASEPTVVEGKGKKPTAVKGKKIEDVGEKIGGARKDIASEMSGKINLNADTFPKMFPKFDLKKLVEKGLDPKMAAAVMFLRQEAMKVFKSKKKRSGTAEALSAAKFFAAYAKRALEEGNTDVTFTDGRWMFTEYGQASIKTNIELYGKIMEKMGTDMLDLDLSDYHIDPIGVGKISGVRHYAYRNDGKGGREQFEPHYTAHAGRSVDYLKEDERDKAFEFVINKLEQNVSYKNAHPYSLSVYRQGSKYFVGTRISGEIEHLTEDFDNLKDANEYLNTNEADLQVKAAQTEQQKKADKKSTAPVAKLVFKSGKENRSNTVISVKIGDEYVPLSDELKDSSVLEFYREHKDELQKKAQQLMDEWFEAKQKAKGWKPELSLGGVGARSGEDYRHGRDIDAEELHNTFGFRGIEFGNYVSQKERQKFLNETYDALMDLSTLLGISPKAIGLGGELGFAIGARGLGAKSGQAHYEPTYNVINLTKKSGAGALAHEWWHALDFFMNRESNTRKASATSVENAEGFSKETRKEMRDAFMHLMETIKGSEYYKRSKALEHRMHPDRASNQTGYFDQPTELGARAFQDYVQRRLMEKGVKNDFLSTFTPEESWNGEAENYPYPTGKDAEKIAEAIDNVFSTIQERTDEDGKAILYHKAEGTAEGVSERDAMLRDAVVDKLREAGIEVVTDTEEAQRILDLANGEVNEHRVYHGSGADFDAFDHSHMGEGEGAQAYGWGTYVTEVEGIGRGYARVAAKGVDALKIAERKRDEAFNRVQLLGKRYNDTELSIRHYKRGIEYNKSEIERQMAERAALVKEHGEESPQVKNFDFYDYIGAARENLKHTEAALKQSEWALKETRKEYSEAKADLEKAEDGVSEAENNIQRVLYTVDIPDDNGENYLSWDEPLSDNAFDRISRGLLKNGWKAEDRDEYTHFSMGNKYVDIYKDEHGDSLHDQFWSVFSSEEEVSKLLSSIGFVGIKYPAEYRSGGREDGAKNFVIFDEADAKIMDKVRFFRTESGEAYGFVKDGKIYLDPRIAGAQTAVHEYTHLWAEALRQSEPEKWKEIADVLQNDKSVAPLMEQVKKNYPELSGDDLIDELLAHYSGKRGAERLNAAADEIEKQNGGVFGKAEAISAIENVKRVLNDFWKKVAELLGFEKKFKNADEVADMVLNDLLSGSAINTATDNKSGQMRFDFGDNENKRATEEDAANTLYSARELVKARQRINSIGNIGRARTKAFEGEDGKRIYNPTVAKNIGEYMVNALQEYKDWLEFYAEDSNATKAYKQRFADHIAEVDKAIEFYNELKDGKITDPNTIYDRNIRYREIGAPLNPRGERMTAQNTSLDEAIAIQGSGIRYSTRVNHNSPFLLKRADGSFVDAETGETLGFDHRFMGTGEGAQAHGWGSYFSANDIRAYAGSVDDEEPGYRYKGKTREDLDDENITEIAAGIIIDKADLDKVSIEQAKEALIKEHTDELDSLHKEKKEQRRPASVMDDLIADETNLLKGLTRLKVADFKYFEPERHHYDVEIPDNDGTNYIEEGGEVDEKILGKVRAELQSRIDEDGMNADYMLEKMDDVDYMDGRLLYKMLTKYAFDGSDEKASKFLKECGIVGIHYDGRQDGECYVIFDESDARIVNHERFRDGEAAQTEERDEDAMEREARALADELGTKVRVVRDVNEIEHPDAATQNRMRESLGWFDPKSGEVVVVIPNNTDAADVRATVLHEIVGHKGLQQVVGKEKFEDFLMKVYRGVDVETRKKINELAARNHWDFYEGIEEYIAQQAERGFEDRENAGLWRKIVQYVRDLLSEAKVRLGMNLGENDVRYMLWKTYQLKKGRRGVFAEAKDVALQNELGVGNYRYRDNGNNAATHPEGADNELRGVALEYNKRLGKGSYQAIEAIQDSMRSLLEVQRILEERSGKPLEDWENAYMAENAMSSRNNAEYEAWKRDNYKPLTEAVRALMESEGLSREGVEEYLYMKHGIERNREMSVRTAISEKAEREGKKAAHAEIRVQRDAAKQNGTDFKEPTDTERKRLEKQKEAEMQKQLRNDWKQKRDEIRKQYPNDWEKAQRELDKAATMVFGADLDAREYSGLTAIMSTDDVADARTRAYDAVKQLMEDRPQECKALDDAVRNAASITLEKPFRSGLIDRATFDDISDMYEYYIPLRGFSETTAEEVYNYLRGDAGHGYSEPIKRAKGRMSQAESPLTYLVQMAQSALVQGNRNIMKQRFYNMALRRPSDLITVSEAWVVKQLNPQTGAEEWVTAYPQIKPEMSADEVEKAVADFENDMMQREAQGEAFKTGSKKGEGIPYRTLHDQLAEHQVIVKRAGREYVLTVNGNPRLAQAVNGKTNPNSNYEGVGGKVKKGLDDVNRKMSQLYTTANPDFVVSNLMRDTAYTWSMALIKEDAAYAKSFIGHWNKNLPKMWTLYNKLQHNTLNMNDQTEREFKNFVMNGGETGYSTLQELEDIKAELDKDLAKGNVKEFVDRKLAAFDRLNRSVENLARFSAYLASRDAGRTVERSVWDAKEISVNFNKKGAGGMFFGTNGQTKLGNIASSMSAIGRGGYIFWNAGIQGMANISKIAKRNPKKFAAGAAVGFALGFILAAIHGDDDDDELGYGDLPEYVRRSNIVIGAGGHYGTIPLPVEYRVMYGMGELAQRVLSGNEKYTNAELAEKVAATITQALPIDPMEGMSGGGKWYSPFIPSYAKPLAEVAVNSDWTGKPIYYENEWNKKMPEWTKVNENTTNSILFATSKMLNEWTGGDDFTSGALDINPAIVEHLAQGYLGGLMTFGNRVMKTGETLVGARDYDSRNIPVANRIYKQPTEYTKESRINSEYRKDVEDMRDLKQKERGYRQKAAEGNAEYAEKYRELVRSREYRKMLRFENLYKQVKKLNDDAGGDERAMKQVKRLKKDAVRVMDNEN